MPQALKIIRYSAKLVLAAHGPEPSHFLERLKALDSSLGTTRKALRLGKFLKNVQNAGAVRPYERHALLLLLAASGEGVYYFLDQFVWLAKAGVLPKAWEAPVARAGAVAELCGYAASITLSLIELRATLEQLEQLQTGLSASGMAEASCTSTTVSQTSAGDEDMVVMVHRQLAEARARALRLRLLLLKDAADSLLALQDALGSRVKVTTPVMAAVCGLVSAAISSWKLWPAS